MAIRSSIWLFRSAKNDDGFVRAFQRAGFQPVSVPVLSTEYLDNMPPFPAEVDAVVVTSRRSVEALARWPEKVTELLQIFPSATWFAVGPATAEALSNLGINVDLKETGHASALAASVIESGVGRVLFLAGEPHRPELSGVLKSNGISVNILTLYRSYPVVPFELSRKPRADWAVFFSPRGTETALRVPGMDWSVIRKAAIGRTTADTLRSLGWSPDAVAEYPDPDSLIRAITNSPSFEQSALSTNRS